MVNMFLTVRIGVIFISFIILNTSLAYQNEDAPVVTLPEGKIQGRVLKSPIGQKKYYAYQEIPYASPPIGNLRFKEPVPPRSWKGILNCTRNTRACFQSGRASRLPPDVFESEDCLHLNVYSPVKPGNYSELEILFWIFGGGFVSGDASFQSYGPQYLIDYDIIIVTINYRLGPLGFLTTEDSVIPGNLGLKDQHLALQWVKKNIALFGGDPGKITIDGESAGGGSVGFHLMSKQSEGLFRGAILQSGTAICTVNPQTNPKSSAFRLGRVLDSNFNSTNSSALLSLLQSVPAEDINNSTKDIEGNPLTWTIVLENEKNEGAFLTGLVYENIRLGNIIQIPILLGYNSEEAISFITDDDVLKKTAEEMDNNISRIVSLGYNMTEEDKYTAGSLLRKLYTAESFQNNISSVIRYLSDVNFTTPIIRNAELQSKYTDVFLYQFSYKGPMGRSNISRPGLDSVGHTEELRYFWHTDILDDGTDFPKEDKLTQQRVLKLWSNFVKDLIPTPIKDPLFNFLVWPSVAPGNIRYMNINKTLEVKTNPRQYRQFTAIVDKYAVPPLNSY